jgi:hypothetical protein
MGRLLGGRHWSAVVTFAAVGALVIGSWFVMSAATVPPPAHATVTTAVQPRNASRALASKAPGASTQITVSATTQPVVQNLVSPTTTLAPSAPTTLAPAASPTPVAPARNTSVPPTKPPIPRKQASQSPMVVPGSSGEAHVAALLIAAINQQANRESAIPGTADNISLLGRWIANEGGIWANNPLNTSHGSAAYPHQFTTSGQDSGIPIFPSMSSGIAATATTLLSNPSYSRILKVLRSGTASCVSFARAVIRSPWASGHYGHDPAGFCSGRIVPVRRGHRHRHAG